MTDRTDEDLEFCDEESLASSVDSSTEEMFLDGLDPFYDRPLITETDSPENSRNSESVEQRKLRKRPHVSTTSTSPKGGNIKNMRTSQSVHDVSTERWHSANEPDVEPPSPVFTPIQTPGPKFVLDSCITPLQFFKLFFSKSLMQTIVGHTNVYGTKCGDKICKRWFNISLKDFMSFIALVIYMGLFKCFSLKDYWSESQYFSMTFPKKVMSYRNFLRVSNAFHLSNTSEDEKNETKKGTSGYDKLDKIQLLYQSIREACRKYFHPFQNITIDERMVTSQDRAEFKECLKSKSASRGCKLFALSDCTTGYTWDCLIHDGKPRASQSGGLGYDSVMALVDENFLGDGYKLFVDKFYTSPVLFRDLRHKNIWACGPIWANRTGFPQTSVNKLSRNAPRGTIRWIRDNKLLFVEWNDACEVQMCSSFHKASGEDTVQRKVKDRDGKRNPVDIPIPDAVLDYKRTMGPVDPSSRITAHYRMLHKPKKWYQCFFYHFLDIAVENAFILHQLVTKERNQNVLTRKAFLETLVEELTEIGSGTYFAPVSSSPSPSSNASRSTPFSSPYSDTTGVLHRPKHISEDRTIGRRRCKHCHLKTPIVCVTCNVSLCFQPTRDCFNEWHDLQIV
ncbi:piggyBac transposable element-derived protein 4-like [Triplophysa dalaica]|uniref:piggyBac transposable element-derived protein 4-like n=1 Tax=Triplophysa dalaica TaxID=1582913 RepID=UPI0024DF367C|nr:piggyBac transposable element-derived protein 4-like [Triplophysa dalaica]